MVCILYRLIKVLLQVLCNGKYGIEKSGQETKSQDISECCISSWDHSLSATFSI